MNENISDINKKINRKRKKSIYVFLLLILALSFVIIFKTNIFSVKDIKIHGNQIISTKELLSQSGITIGNNIFKEKLSQIESNIQRHPYVKQVKVKRSLPNTIKINIVEKTEAAAIPFMGEYLIIDDQGIVLKADTEHRALKIINGLKFENFVEGQALNVKDAAQFELILQVIKSIDKHEIPAVEIDIADKSNIIVKFSDLLKAEIGKDKDFDYKFALLKEILKDLAQKDIVRGVIDMSHEGYPSYRPVE